MVHKDGLEIGILLNPHGRGEYQVHGVPNWDATGWVCVLQVDSYAYGTIHSPRFISKMDGGVVERAGVDHIGLPGRCLGV